MTRLPRTSIRYSESFKIKVINELESGRFSSLYQAQHHYEIKGSVTVKKWLIRYGRNHLIPKVVRVETPDEQQKMQELKDEVRRLKEALGETQAENLLNRAFLKIACGKLGQDVDTFKKKSRYQAVHDVKEDNCKDSATVKSLCKLCDMTRQNYYKQRKQRHRQAINEALILELVKRERCLQPRLGARKLMVLLARELRMADALIGRDRFFKLLSENNLLIQRRRRFAKTTDSRHMFKVYKNLLQEMELTGPHQAYVSDITYIRTDSGFMYLALIMDAYSRKIVGFDSSDSLEAEGCLRALSMALKALPAGFSPIHHSDRGSQYCCKAYIALLKKKGLEISMTEENHCYENSQAERLNGILKQEYGLGSTFLSKADVKKAVKQAIMLYNHCRPHVALEYRIPANVHEAA
ncbi:MAG: IS3 family transposase [Desulfobulbaceae bacterium]|nr:IS3 family transposase [Desulfobulbaceae bacterium]